MDTAASQTLTHDGARIDLRNRAAAVALTFVVPGGGHFYQGRQIKAAVYAIGILGLFLMGLWIGSGRVVYASWSEEDWRWQYIPQAFIGLPAAPAAVQAWWVRTHPRPLAGGVMAPPNSIATLNEWHKVGAMAFDLGTLYTMIAGILNLLVAFDAYAGPLPPPRSHKSAAGADSPPDVDTQADTDVKKTRREAS